MTTTPQAPAPERAVPAPGEPDPDPIGVAAPAHPHHEHYTYRESPYGIWIAWTGFGVFSVIFAVALASGAVPLTARDTFFFWLIGGLLAVSLTNLKRWFYSVFIDWLPLFVLLAVYDVARGWGDESGIEAHVWPQLRFDEMLLGGHTATELLQNWLLDPNQWHWYDYAAWFVYMTHFGAAFVCAAVLWKVAYHRFHHFVACFAALTVLGCITYIAFPAVPPWMAGEWGLIPDSTRVVGHVWGQIGFESAGHIWLDGPDYVNQVAAMPSLHAAYPFLIALFFWKGAPGWVKPILALYPLAMAWTLMYGAEHYILDIVVGWLYAAVVFAAAAWARSAWKARDNAVRAAA